MLKENAGSYGKVAMGPLPDRSHQEKPQLTCAPQCRGGTHAPASAPSLGVSPWPSIQLGKKVCVCVLSPLHSEDLKRTRKTLSLTLTLPALSRAQTEEMLPVVSTLSLCRKIHSYRRCLRAIVRQTPGSSSEL